MNNHQNVQSKFYLHHYHHSQATRSSGGPSVCTERPGLPRRSDYTVAVYRGTASWRVNCPAPRAQFSSRQERLQGGQRDARRRGPGRWQQTAESQHRWAPGWGTATAQPPPFWKVVASGDGLAIGFCTGSIGYSLVITVRSSSSSWGEEVKSEGNCSAARDRSIAGRTKLITTRRKKRKVVQVKEENDNKRPYVVWVSRVSPRVSLSKTMQKRLRYRRD